MTTSMPNESRRSASFIAAAYSIFFLLAFQVTSHAAPSSQENNSVPIGTTIEEAEALFFGSTVLSVSQSDDGDFAEIEYIDQFGNAYLWYPGNRAILQGKLEFRGDGDDLEACFQYSVNYYNPITKSCVSDWMCNKKQDREASLKDIKKGDVFQLDGGEVREHTFDPDVATPYLSKDPEAQFPFITNGKTPIENIQALWVTNTHKPAIR